MSAISGAPELRELRSAVRAAGPRVRATTVESRAQAIERACQLLLDARSPLGSELRRALVTSSGLSLPGVEHGLQTTLGTFQQDGLTALHAQRPEQSERESPELATVVLAGNVFSAAARPLLLPLLCGVPVLLKAASSDDVLPRALQHALAHVDRELAAACAVLTFGREETALSAALLEDAELLSVYGDDDTVSALRSLAPAGTRFVAHGHGFGLAFVSGDALESDQRARVVAALLARDIAAYDQRGCLSPHAAFVQAGSACDAQRFARLLADALDELATSWPRGPLPAGAAAEQAQWRGVAAATGELHVRDGAAVSYARNQPLRASPGCRNVAVYDCPNAASLRAQLVPLALQLKALGLASASDREALRDAAPYVCAIGAMQEPPLDAPLDGLHPLAGL